MDALDITIEDPRWGAVDLQSLATTACMATVSHMQLAADQCEIGILACDDARIAILNADFRDKPQPTNVLSWPAEERAASRPGARPELPAAGPDGLIELGDIAISFDTCQREAVTGALALYTHTTHLMVHAVLHLLGYDHISDPDAELMEGLETEILGKLGIDDPYRET